ncbi:helix-turn-helix transcriptional regulator [Brachymonas sp.]|uniref:S24 family peptidase n=1 Tax=Brachymonas sp. TaxID=1936292 RepID=UPI0035B3AB3D
MTDKHQARREALKRLIDDQYGGKKADFARKSGIDATYVQRLLADPTKAQSRNIGEEIVDKITALHPTWLTGNGEPVMAIDLGESTPEHLVLIPESTARLSAGNGSINYDTGESDTAKAYDRQWLSQARLNPRYLRRFKVRGDSMENTLYSGDTVLVNELETQIIDGKVYALLVGDDFRVKRLYTMVDGSLILHSDNAHWVPRQETLTPQQVQDYVRIIGRVRDKSGPGGL